MKITIFGLSITSSWGNGHATTYRSLCRALAKRGHDIVFFEKDQEWYSGNRDMPEPPFCKVHLYQNWSRESPRIRRVFQDSDLAIVGSYVPEGADVIDEVIASAVPVKAFYDIDTPITIAELRRGDADYVRREQIAEFDLYLSFTGGPILTEIESRFGAQRALPFYCSVDPDRYSFAPGPEFQCDLSYMGTYATDRQPKIEKLFCEPARHLPQSRFLIAGPMYPESMRWPANVRHVIHLEPKFHPAFYSSSRFTLNITRSEMVSVGFSPSVRLFEAAACGATIISDCWPGLELFLEPRKEILLANSAKDVIGYLKEITEEERRAMGRAARARILSEHTAEHRAAQLETYVEAARSPAAISRESAALT
jgi:spore maturation protein CgeB